MPNYDNIHLWELYSHENLTEYQQSIEQGLDIEAYKGLFEEAAKVKISECAQKTLEHIK